MSTRNLQSLDSLRALTVDELLTMRRAVETALAEKRQEIERDLAQISGALALPAPLVVTAQTLH